MTGVSAVSAAPPPNLRFAGGIDVQVVVSEQLPSLRNVVTESALRGGADEIERAQGEAGDHEPVAKLAVARLLRPAASSRGNYPQFVGGDYFRTPVRPSGTPRVPALENWYAPASHAPVEGRAAGVCAGQVIV